MKLNQYGRFSYPFKLVAFVKAEIFGQEKIFYYVVDKNRDLQEFIDRILEPRRFNSSHKISPENYRYTSFHKKVKGSKEFTMAGNPEYVISHSQRRGFFSKVGTGIQKL